MCVVPMYLNSPADFAAAIQIGVTPESLVLDFKSMVPTQDPKEPKELCRDVAQFANTDGGCLLIGVEEKLDPVTKLKTASGIKTVADPNALTQWMEQAIRNWLVPATFSHPIVPIQTPQGIVLAANVYPSQHTVYLWDDQSHTIEVPRRTSHGKDWMNPDELERHIMNGSRAAKIRIGEVAGGTKTAQVELIGGWYSDTAYPAPPRRQPHGLIQLGQIGDRTFELRIPLGPRVHGVEIPYEVVRAAWIGVGGQINIMLTVRVVNIGASFTLLPFEA
jgi:hypothetical protein